jgi:hypothetical protein
MRIAGSRIGMNALKGFQCLTALVFCSWAFAAAAQTKVLFHVITEKGVLQYSRNSKGQAAISTPQFKLYGVDGQLLASGTAEEMKGLRHGDLKQVQAGTSGVRILKLEEELLVLGLPRGTRMGSTLMIYESEPCPPCETLAKPVIEHLKRLHGSSFAVQRLTIVMR